MRKLFLLSICFLLFCFRLSAQQTPFSTTFSYNEKIYRFSGDVENQGFAQLSELSTNLLPIRTCQWQYTSLPTTLARLGANGSITANSQMQLRAGGGGVVTDITIWPVLTGSQELLDNTILVGITANFLNGILHR